MLASLVSLDVRSSAVVGRGDDWQSSPAGQSAMESAPVAGQRPFPAGGSYVGELSLVPIELIDVPPMRVRQHLEGIDELAFSMASVGLLHPIQVYRARERYRLVAGERRLSAARLLGWAEIHAFVRARSDDDLLLELVENTQRRWLTDAEEADALIRLVREKQLDSKDVAAQAGRSEGYVSKRLRLFEDPVLRPAVEAGDITVSAAEELLGLAAAPRAALLAEAIAGGWNSMRLRQAVRELSVSAPQPEVTIIETAPEDRSSGWADDDSVVEADFREVEAAFPEDDEQDADELDESLVEPRGALPSARPSGITRQIRDLSKTLRGLRAWELTPADERALASLLDALLRLARAHSKTGHTGGPVFPSLEQAEQAVRRAKSRNYGQAHRSGGRSDGSSQSPVAPKS